MAQLRRFLLILALVSGLSVLTLGAAAAGEIVIQDQPQIAQAGGEESDDLHVSDETLATSLFIPFVFVGVTIWIFVWAVRNRATAEDDIRPMPWWRTRGWYTADDDEA